MHDVMVDIVRKKGRSDQAMKRPIGETYWNGKRFYWMVHRLAETSKEQDEASEQEGGGRLTPI